MRVSRSCARISPKSIGNQRKAGFAADDGDEVRDRAGFSIGSRRGFESAQTGRDNLSAEFVRNSACFSIFCETAPLDWSSRKTGLGRV